MNKTRLVWIVLLSLLTLTACGKDGIYTIRIISGGEFVVSPGTVEAADILLLDGSLTLHGDAVVQGDIYQVMGVMELAGTVTGNVMQFSGDMVLAPGAQILGNLQTGGGQILGDPDQVVSGTVTRSSVRAPFSPEWFASAFQRRFLWISIKSLLVTLLAAILGASAPNLLIRVRQAIRKSFLVSSAMGLLVAIVGASLVVQMAFTVLLIPVSLLGIVLFSLAIAMGWCAFGMQIGHWLSGKFQLTWSLPAVSAAGTLVLMIVLDGLSFLPLVGDLPALATAISGLGAVFLTRFGLRPFTPANLEVPESP